MAQLAHDCPAPGDRWTGRGERRAGPAGGQPTFEPVISLLGTGWPFFAPQGSDTVVQWVHGQLLPVYPPSQALTKPIAEPAWTG